MLRTTFPLKMSLILLLGLISGLALLSAFKPAVKAKGASLMMADLAPALLVKMLPTDTTSVPLGISDIDIDIKVTGNIAVTTMTLNFYNDVNRNLEGEFVFPLAEGQTIHYFAMGTGDKMRQGVVVEKEQGRQIFESVERTQIDPGLLEWTKGNNFRARVFPIPAKGYKKFVIGFQQELTSGDSSFYYSLPLAFRNKVSRLNINATVNGSEQQPIIIDGNAYMLDFRKANDYWQAAAQYKNVVPNKTIAFQIPATNNLPVVYTAKIPGSADNYYFYALLNTHKVNTGKHQPTNLGIIWDVSGSAAKRDRDKELNIIETYLDKPDNVKVKVIAFSVAVEPIKDFTITNGNSVELRNYLQSLEPDGATQLGCLHLADYSCDEFLMFSDGVQTFGSDSMQFSKSPVHCIATGNNADFSSLQFISRSTGGKFINAQITDPPVIISALAQNDFSFLFSQITSGQLTSVYPSLPTACGTYFGVAGIMNGKTGQLQLNFGSNSISPQIINLNITAEHKADADLLGRLWAQKKIAELDLQFDKNKDEITGLGKHYSVITRNTSLLVLDRLQDYIRYKITPPDEDMKKQYQAYLNEQKGDDKDRSRGADNLHLTQVVNDFNQIVKWWNIDFKPVKPDTTKLTGANGTYLWNASDSVAVSGDPNARPTIQFVETNVRRSRENSSSHITSQSASYTVVTTTPVQQTELQDVVERMPGVTMSNGEGSFAKSKKAKEKMANDNFLSSSPSLKGDIQLKAWDPKEPYLDELKKSGEKDLYKKYLSIRKQYQESPSFFVDAADYLVKMNQKQEAVRVISNLAELKSEDHELMRIMAHHLQQWNEMGPAINAYKAIIKLRAEEPQSYRDLGLAYEQNKEFQKAEELLCHVVNKQWDGRFPTIEAFSACELNHLLAKSPVKLKTDSLDNRLIKNLPVDVRVVINWDADDCDIDLWVTDPYGEKCFYSNKQTKAGGRISSDFTGGYGPEDFNLKKAIPGVYKVQVNYFGSHKQTLAGPVTVQAEMYTNYGRPNEAKKETTVRLTSGKEVIDIGEFEFVR